MTEILKIYTDGGSRGNPGLGATAFVVLYKDKIIHKEARSIGICTNNEAEYKAVILALEWLVKYLESNDIKKIFFYLDSQLVVRQLNGLYKIKNEKLIDLNSRIRKILSSLPNNKVFFVSVEREKNKLADKLVNIELN